jgi:hypothetical protein
LPVFADLDVDPVLDLTGGDLLVSSSPRSGNRLGEVRAAGSLSAVFGAAVVAAGGYRLVLGEPDRFRGRWLPGRSVSKRWAGRRISVPIP